ncbi:carbohydrate ABC transporter permease [Alicyclobacillus acidiphilus]|uniref:carbohydrate ABC transporter permease n=1 Tax=Alicyclobacillus acidiphilus TaxID=182455 RepID=UPI000834A4F8|nr:sugar ABC transporter permease [Alicyclobacillus acidiphilus]
MLEKAVLNRSLAKKIRRKISHEEKARLKWGYVFIAPTIFGMCVFVLAPVVFGLIISFTHWDIITPMRWAGLSNYKKIFTSDPLFYQSLRVTFYYAIASVILTNILALFLATLLNAKIRFKSFFRTVFYIPTIVPLIAAIVIWSFIYNPEYGLLNSLLGLFHIPPQNWLYNARLVIPAMIVMSMWGAGNNMVIYLAALQGVPRHLYEAIDVDGGGAWRRFWNVTLPMISPMIFFNFITDFINSLQTFAQGQIMTDGGPNNASLFYILNVYNQAFTNNAMGYAAALAWVLFIIVAICVGLIFRFSNRWIYYEGGEA